jgi:hypothetical protein
MKASNTTLKEIILLYIIPVLLVVTPALLYIGYRAYHFSFTCDESLSFFIARYHDQQYATSANNHLLNTGLMKVFGVLFGDSEFSLRLPNVLAFVLFSIAGLGILKNIKKPELSVFFMAILVFNPIMLEFFGLARGYGLSIGLLLASFYFLFKLENQALPVSKYLVYLVLCLVFSLLALYANLNSLNIHIAFLAVLITGLFLYIRTAKENIDRKKWIAVFAAVFGIDIIALIPAITKLRMLQQLNAFVGFGDHQGLIKTTLQSLITYFYFHEQDFPTTFNIIRVFVITTFALTCLWFLYSLTRKVFNNFSRIFLIFSLLLIAPVLQEVFFNIPYPADRTAILYYPVFSLLLIFFIVELIRASKKSFLRVSIVFSTIVISSLITYNIFIKHNLVNTVEWYYEAHNKEILEVISKDRIAQGSQDSVSISNFWALAPAINYYRVTKPYPWLLPSAKEDYKKADYYICFYNEESKIPSDSLQLLIKFDDVRMAAYREYKPDKKVQ